MEPRDANIILVSGKGWFPEAIRWAQKEPGEPSIFNHLALQFFMYPHLAAGLTEIAYEIPAGWVGQYCVIEAKWRVTITPWEEFKAGHEAFAMAQCLDLAPAGAERIVRHALTYAAQPYSVARLLAQGWEKLTGEPVTLRFGPGHVICSALIALPYWVELAIRFDGKHWRRCTPDDIGDHVQKTPGWRFAWIKGERRNEKILLPDNGLDGRIDPSDSAHGAFRGSNAGLQPRFQPGGMPARL